MMVLTMVVKTVVIVEMVVAIILIVDLHTILAATNVTNNSQD